MALGLPLETPRDFKVYNASINRFRVDRTASWRW
jgi:probable phosphoglycerate mutase